MTDERINIGNYEIFIIDYLDGKLSANQSVELMLFLENNPDIKEEFNDLNKIFLSDYYKNADFSELKKPLSINPPTKINSQNIDEYLISKLEGDANESEIEEIRVFLAGNSQYAENENIINKTKLPADLNIQFSDKNILYKLTKDFNEAINIENFSEYCIAYFEGDLPPEKENELLSFKNSDIRREVEFNAFARLKMLPDNSVIFNDKKSLKKPLISYNFNLMKFYRITAIAAILVILYVFSSVIKVVNNTYDYPVIAKNIEKRVSKDASSNNLKSILSTNNQEINKPNRKAEINRISIKIATKKEAMLSNYIAEDLQIKSYKKVFDYSVASSPRGYYEVKDEESSFLKENPSLTKFMIKKVRNFLNISAENIKASDDKFSLWDVADAGLKGIGALTENDIVLSRK